MAITTKNFQFLKDNGFLNDTERLKELLNVNLDIRLDEPYLEMSDYAVATQRAYFPEFEKTKDGFIIAKGYKKRNITILKECNKPSNLEAMSKIQPAKLKKFVSWYKETAPMRYEWDRYEETNKQIDALILSIPKLKMHFIKS